MIERKSYGLARANKGKASILARSTNFEDHIEYMDEFSWIPEKEWDEESYWADQYDEMRARELHEMGVEL